MNKADIAKEVSNLLSSKKEASAVVDMIFNVISERLRRGNKVVITGFGSFKTIITEPKNGRNPKTGERLMVAPMRKIRFKQSKDFFNKE